MKKTFLSFNTLIFSLLFFFCNSASAENTVLVDELEVCAHRSRGSTFNNFSSFDYFRIRAYGTWTGGGDNPIHDANGSNRDASHPERLPCPDCENGSLVGHLNLAKGGQYSYEEIGRYTDRLYIPSDSSFIFMMNDYGWNNNEGCLFVNIYGIEN